MKLLLVPCMLAVSGCASSMQATTTARPVHLSQEQVKEVHEGVRKALKDPGSAQFGEMSAVIDGGMITVCGFVNAKNSFGGFTGQKRYIGMLADSTNATTKKRFLAFSVAAMGGGQADDFAVNEVCRKAGIS